MSLKKIEDMTIKELKLFAFENGYEVPKEKKLKKDILSFIVGCAITNSAERKEILGNVARDRIITRRRHLRGRR